MTGEGDHPGELNAILYEDRAELTRARIAEDDRLIAVVERYDEAALASLHSYKTTSGMPQSQVLSDILLHLFNHQTHHRGQAHACLSIDRWRAAIAGLVGVSTRWHRAESRTLMSHNGK